MKSFIHIDKLKLCYIQPSGLFESLLTTPHIIGDGYELRVLTDLDKYKEKGKTPHILTAQILYPTDGEMRELCIFEFHSKNHLHDDRCFCDFSNRALYDVQTRFNGYPQSALHFIFSIADDLHLELNNITHIEIAVDTTANITNRIIKHIRDYTNYDLILKHKRITSPTERLSNVHIASPTSRQRLLPQKSIYFNSAKHTDPAFCCYNKSEEVADNDNVKSYILDFLNFGNQTVHRAEIRLYSESIKEFMCSSKWEYDNAEHFLMLLTDPYRLAEIWHFFVSRLIYFKNKSTGERLDIIYLIQ